MPVTSFKERILEKWNSLTPEEKRKIVLLLIIIVIIVGGYLGYKSTRPSEKKDNKTAIFGNVTLDVDMIQRTQYAESLRIYEELKKQLEDIRKDIEENKKKIEQIDSRVGEMPKDLPSIVSPPPSPPPPPPPPPPPSSLQKKPVGEQLPGDMPGGQVQPLSPLEKVETVGGIGIVKGSVGSQQVGGQVAGDKAEGKGQVPQQQIMQQQVTGVPQTGGQRVKKKYFLLPSFMEATLLSGLDAPAVMKGEGNPVPCLFRVKAPAVLPNEVRANLKGCFVIGEGVGNLATERADIRTVSLSCIDKKGRTVINEKIKGFVVGNDGKIGLRGRVVSKMGAVLARSLLAGFISGFASHFGTQMQPVVISSEGTSQQVDFSKSFRQGTVMGVQSAANEIVKFYMDLARQTIPVVEVLPTTNVTIVISEGVWLNLMDYEGS